MDTLEFNRAAFRKLPLNEDKMIWSPKLLPALEQLTNWCWITSEDYDEFQYFENKEAMFKTVSEYITDAKESLSNTLPKCTVAELFFLTWQFSDSTKKLLQMEFEELKSLDTI